jgi:uncharacterized glyoxalase superfamily protein PhnB
MTTTVFPTFRTHDAARLIDFLKDLGLTERLVIRDDDSPDQVIHAEFAWREQGGIMFGSVRGDGSPLDHPEGTSIYLVARDDEEVDRMYSVALDHGADVLRSPTEQDHGGREADLRDQDGINWSIGSYPGA